MNTGNFQEPRQVPKADIPEPTQESRRQPNYVTFSYSTCTEHAQFESNTGGETVAPPYAKATRTAIYNRIGNGNETPLYDVMDVLEKLSTLYQLGILQRQFVFNVAYKTFHNGATAFNSDKKQQIRLTHCECEQMCLKIFSSLSRSCGRMAAGGKYEEVCQCSQRQIREIRNGGVELQSFHMIGR